MDNRVVLNAEELLEKIFYYMTKLFEEKDFSKTIELITNLGSTIVNADRTSFWFWDKKKKQYWTVAAMNNSKITISENSGIVGKCIRNNKVVLSNEPYSDDSFNGSVDRETGYITKSVLCMPVTNSDGDVIGAFQALNKYENDGKFNDADIKKLSLVAVFCGKSLESYLLHNEAERDQLTGLKNRYAFYEIYNRRILPEANKSTTSLVMGDIDYFKKVNDTYGHNIGDKVLMHVAEIFREAIGIDDEVVRWGGEEFIIILRNKGIGQARKFAENLRKVIEESPYDNKLNFTMSFGVSELDNKYTLEENVKLVDSNLYKAKELGRNIVV